MLRLFHGAFQLGDPAVQYFLVQWLDLGEDNSHTQHGLAIDDFGPGREGFLIVGDADRNAASDRPHLPRADVAPKRAKIANHLIEPGGGLQVG